MIFRFQLGTIYQSFKSIFVLLVKKLYFYQRFKNINRSVWKPYKAARNPCFRKISTFNMFKAISNKFQILPEPTRKHPLDIPLYE